MILGYFVNRHTLDDTWPEFTHGITHNSVLLVNVESIYAYVYVCIYTYSALHALDWDKLHYRNLNGP